MSSYNENSLKTARFFTGTAPEVTPVLNFETKLPELDKATGLPVYKVTGEVVVDGKVDGTVIKITSAVVPVVAPRSDYIILGLTQTPYVVSSNNRQGISYKGTALEAVKASFSKD